MADSLITTWKIDTSAAEAGAKRLRAEVKKTAEELSKQVKFELGTGPAAEAIEQLGDSFEVLMSGAEQSLKLQRSALASMIATGQKGTAAYKELQEQIQKSVTEVERLTAASNEAGDSQKGLGDIIKTAISFDAAEKAGAFLSELDEMAGQSKESLRALQIQSKGNAEEFARLKTASEDALRGGFQGSLTEARNGIAAAQQQLSNFLSPDQVNAFAVTASQIGKQYDKEVNEVIGKSRTLISNFKLEGADAGDVLAVSLRDAGNGMDDVLDTLDEYSQLAASVFGASKEGAQQFTGILTKGIQAGVRDTDKLADSIKEFNIRASAGDIETALKDISSPITATINGILDAGKKGTITMGEVLQRSTATIEEAFKAKKISASMRTQLQVAIAGTPAEDIGAELFGRIFSAPVDTAAVGRAGKEASEQLAANFKPNIFQKVGAEIDIIKTKALDLAAPFVAGAGNVLQSVGQIGPAVSLISSQFGGLSGVLKAVQGGISGAGGGLASFATGPVGIAIGVIGLLVTGFILLYKNSETFRAAVDKLVDRVKTFVTQLIQKAKPAIDALWEVLKAVGEIILVIAEQYISAIIFQFELFYDLVSAVVTGITDFIAGLYGFEDAGSFIQAAMVDIGVGIDAFKIGLETVKETIDNVKFAIQGIGSVVGGLVTSLFTLDFEGFTSKLATAFDDAARIANEKRAAAQRKELANLQNNFFKQQVSDFQTQIDALTKNGELTLEQIKKRQEEFGGDIGRILKANFTAETKDGAFAAVAEIDRIAEEARKSLEKKATPKIDPKPLEQQFQDLTDQYLSLFRTTEKALSDLRIKGIKDEGARRRAEIEANRDQQVTALRDAYEKFKRDVNDPTKKDPIKINGKIVSNAEAIRLFGVEYEKQIKAVNESAALDLGLAQREALEKALQEFLDTQKENRDRAIKIAQDQEKLITGNSKEELEKRLAFQLEVLRLQQQQELDEYTANLPEFKKIAKRIQEDFLSGKLKTTDDVAAAYRSELTVLQQTNDGALIMQKRFGVDRVKLERDFLTQFQDLADLLGDADQRARAQALRAAQRQYDKELDIAGTNIELKLRAEANYSLARAKIEQDYLAKTNVYYAAALAARAKFEELTSPEARRNRDAQDRTLQDQIAGLTEQERAARLSYARRESDAEQFRDTMIGIEAERARLTQEIEENKLTAQEAINQSASAGFQRAAELNGKKLSQMVDDYSKGTGKFTDLLESASVSMVAIVGQAAVEQQRIGRASAQGALDTALTLLSAKIPIWIASLYGEDVTKLGAAGLVTATVAAGTLYGIIGYLKAQAENIKFHTGGVDIRSPHGRGTEFDAKLLDGETVFDPFKTQRFRALFHDIQTGKVKDPKDLTQIRVVPVGVGMDRRDDGRAEERFAKALASLQADGKETRAELKEHRKELRWMSGYLRDIREKPTPENGIGELSGTIIHAAAVAAAKKKRGQ